ncbi:MAG: acyltransferase [Oscillospiraceae bacterium]|nr:acyltransferase [Oscillospiraceae bacterium]
MEKRSFYIDLLRILASVFVVFMHTAAGGLRTDVAGHVGWFCLAAMSSFAFCAVPLFFMITGYLLTASEQTNDVKVLFMKRLPRLVVPLMFWSVLHIFWDMLFTGDFSASKIWILSISALQKPINVSFWFMYTLVGMYLISPLLCVGLRNLSKQGERLLLGIIILIEFLSAVRIVAPAFSAMYLDFDVLKALDLFSGHLASFILGWYLGKTEMRLSKVALCVTAATVFAIIFTGTVLRSSAAGEYITAFQSQSAGFEILLASCVFLLVKQIPATDAAAVRKLIHTAAKHTFPIYLMHALLLRIFARLEMAASLTAVSLTAVLWKTIVVYMISLAIAEFCSRTPVLSYLACGRVVAEGKENNVNG